MIKISKYPLFKQEETKDCGAACLYMIIEYYKGHLSMEKIRELLKIDNQGTTAYHLVEGSKKIGFEAKGVKCSLDDINEDNIVLPCIANVIINNSYKHFVVIYKIDFINNKLLIADPANKMMTMSFDIFKSIFSGIIIMLYPNDEIPNNKISYPKLKLVVHIIKSHPKLVKNIIILSFFITCFSIVSSFFLEKLNNTILSYKAQDIIILYLLVFESIVFLKCLSKYFREKLVILINEKISLKMTLDTFEKILLLPYKSYHSKTTGDLVTRILDVETVKNTLSNIFLTVLVDFPLSICSIIILVMVNPRLFIISFIILVLYLIVMLIFKDYFDSSLSEIKERSIDTTNFMIESINNFETVKGLKIHNRIFEQFEKKYVSMLKKKYSHSSILSLQQLLKSFISDGGLFLIYGMGAIMVINNQLTFSSLLTFGALINYFFEPVQNLVNLEIDIRELDLVLNRLNDLELSDSQGITDDICKGSIIFKNLNYTYNDKYNVLNNISFKIKSGQKLLIIGNSGSGKSTLVKLLMKYYDIPRDKIFINNIDINDYRNIRGINYISQSENLFTDSIYNNIVLYDELSINKINEVCELCEVLDIVKEKSLGYNYLIEENGIGLSGGQKQRIILARSLLKKFNILIIDEGLNQVDINLERRILKRLFDKYKDKTIIVISHRLENMDLYDRRILLENGVIKEDAEKI